jgi:hypothetical protein
VQVDHRAERTGGRFLVNRTDSRGHVTTDHRPCGSNP